jgi:4-methylaminobutanoate oxidase (formaldehyde-forming)
MRTQARAVVIGGGVAGASILYHLARLGWRDVVLVEQFQLTHGSTWHSAGLVGQLRSTLSLTRMMQYSVGLYAELARETGKDPGWHELGGLRLACTPARDEEIRRQAAWAKTFGLALEIVSPQEAQELFPLMSTEGVRSAAFLPQDGYLDPSQLTFALADGARRLGAELETRTRVTGIRVKDGRVAAVETDKGTIETEVVVAACGIYTPDVARLVGVDVPIIPFGHQYLVTEPFDPPLRPLPTLRDPDGLVYWRTEVGGLVQGGYERNPAPWGLDGVPADFEAALLPEDWDRFEELSENAIRRVPAMETAQIKRFFNGPEAFTPDGEFCLGESVVPGFWVAAGFCAHGLAGAGGVGKVMAEWIVDGQPEYDVWHMDLKRFGRHYRSQRYTLARTYEGLSKYYDIKYPAEERKSARPLRVSPAYARLAELDAVFGEKAGWERVNWFARNEADGDESLRPRGWAGQVWSPAIGAEALATRRAAGIFDQSSFSKLEVLGPGATAFLERLAANAVDRPVGSIVYTQLLNPRGGIEADLSVTRLGPDRYQLVTGTAFGDHDRAWIERHLPDDGSVHVRDVTSGLACFCVWGPRARDVMQPLTRTSLANVDFPYLTARELTIGHVPLLAARVTYVGELGWELYAPMEQGRAMWDALWEAGQPHGLIPSGIGVYGTTGRIEKGYRLFGAELESEYNVVEAGMQRPSVKDADFVGKEAHLRHREEEPAAILSTLTIDDPTSSSGVKRYPIGREPILAADGSRLVDAHGRGSYVTSAGSGPSVGKHVLMSYLPPEAAVEGNKLLVQYMGERYPVTVEVVGSRSLFDPENMRVRS